MGLLRVIKKEDHNSAKIVQILNLNKQIKFVSLMGVDLGGNATDEKIPVELFKKDIDDFLYRGIQTDGSSVELHEIATLNNAKVDLLPDLDVNWYIDYNTELTDYETNLPVGTLKIPSFLIHNNKKVCSRGILQRATNNLENTLIDLLKKYPNLLNHVDIDSVDDIEKINITSATELEFWVSTPEDKADLDKLYVSQSLKEQYWKKTQGTIRSALERTLIILQELGVEPEMGHKEVGGMKGHMDTDGNMTHVCEQVEIDWKFADALQAADNELVVRILVKEIFRENGLEVNFKAKPMIGLAGNGEHTHFGIGAIMNDGSFVNLFAPTDMKKDFMSAVGYGAIMGLLKNYEVINPFVSATNDSLNRLKPGFEAPVCIVTSLGHKPEVPSRNRTILAGLIRDVNNPKATRFELRACNPYTNTYLVLAAIYTSILDGVKYAVTKTTAELLAEISKDVGDDAGYLEKDRAYRAEDDVFEDYTEEERHQRFGVHPATVWENFSNLKKYPEKRAVLTEGKAFSDKIIDAFVEGELIRWKTELISRIIPENRMLISKFKEIKSAYVTDEDSYNWNKLNRIRYYLAKDSIDNKSLFTQLINALNSEDFATASSLQVEMYDKMEELKELYATYRNNMI